MTKFLHVSFKAAMPMAIILILKSGAKSLEVSSRKSERLRQKMKTNDQQPVFSQLLIT